MLKSAFSSPKIRMLALRLNVPFPHAVGMCGMLWNFTADHAPRGDIGKVDDSTIAFAVEWAGSVPALIEALVSCRLIDRDATHRLVIHDWHEHCPRYVHAKLAKAKQAVIVPTTEQTVERTTERTTERSVDRTTSSSSSSSAFTSSSPNGKGRGGGGGGGDISEAEETDPTGHVRWAAKVLAPIFGDADARSLAVLTAAWPRATRFDRLKALVANANTKASPKSWLRTAIRNEGKA